MKIVTALFPVFAFLAVLLFLDSYKLVKFRSILTGILYGSLIAGSCFLFNRFLLLSLQVDPQLLRRYLAPVIEELAKGIYLLYLLKNKKAGFMVDAAIFGFSIGAGFAFVENIHYLYALKDSNLLLWMMRGFGTAIMHGGTTAIVGIITRSLLDRHPKEGLLCFVPGFGVAIITHSFFNHFFIHPLLSTIGILLILPVIMIVVFGRSEMLLRKWLDVGFISDIELLEMIRSGKVLTSRIGEYLLSLKNSVSDEVLADMLCYLQISVELALKAKGTLLMHEAGFKTSPDTETMGKLKELKDLERNIGKTGKRILAPFLHVKSQDLWQIHMLERYSSTNHKKNTRRNESSKYSEE